MTDQSAKPGIGHNRPSFDDIVAGNLRRGLYLTQRDVLIGCLRDERLSHRHRLVLAKIIEHMNTRDGMAYPGRRALAEATTYYNHEWIERNYTEPGIAKTISELIDFGYLATARRAPEGSKRALAHYTIVKRSTEELQAEITAYIEEIRRQGPRLPLPDFQKGAGDDLTSDVTPVRNVTPVGNVTSLCSKADVTPVVSADVTPVVPTVTSRGTRREDSHPNSTSEEGARADAREAFEEYRQTAKRCDLAIPPKPDPWLPNIKARLKEHGREGWRDMLAKVEQSSFLLGHTGDWRGADLDWLCKPKNFAKVLSGKYGNGGSGAHGCDPERERQIAETEALWRRLSEEEDAKCEH